jgi:molecular chaperone DnaJ
MRRDYYAVLGVAATAAPREVRRAYQRLARQYSPDVNFWDERARELFDEIAEAFRVLGDPTARQMYDRFGHAVGDDDALAEGRRGDDVHAVVDLSFAGVVRGTGVRLEVQRFSPCAECGASGTNKGVRCAACLGRGVRRVVEPIGVAVPAGVDSGAQIRVAGEGNAGPFGGPRGDLIVSTRVAEHPFFRRKGDSVHCDVPISVWEALLGARIRVPTPSGEAVLVVPPGTTGGQVFRLRGQGLPRLTGESTGDLYATVRVEVPTGLDARTHELVRQLARLMPVETRTALERYRGGAE